MKVSKEKVTRAVTEVFGLLAVGAVLGSLGGFMVAAALAAVPISVLIIRYEERASKDEGKEAK